VVVLVAADVLRPDDPARVPRPHVGADAAIAIVRNGYRVTAMRVVHEHVQDAVHRREPGDAPAVRREPRERAFRVVEQVAEGNEGRHRRIVSGDGGCTADTRLAIVRR
jgi:hypothetical protein